MKFGEVRVKTRESLRYKLTLYFAVLTFIPLVVLSIIAYTITRSQLEKQLSSALQLMASETQDKIDRFIYHKVKDVISWSRYPILKGAISFGITDLVEAYLQNNLSALPEYKGVALFNRDGEAVASVGEMSLLEKGRGQSSATWFKKTLNEGLSIADAVKYKDEVRLGISAAVVDLETKEIIGVLLAELDFASIKEITAPVKVTPNPQDQSLTIINKEGMVILDADEAKIFNLNMVKEGYKSAKIVTSEKRDGNVIDPNIGRLVGFAYSKGYKDFKGGLWSLLLGVRYSAVVAPVMRLRDAFITIILITLIIIIIVAVLVSRRITVPIALVTSAILNIAEREADLTQKISYTSKDEIGMLVLAFNKIIDSIYNLVKQVKDTADKLASSAQQLSSSTQEINASTQEVSSAIQQVTKGATTQVDRVEETFELMEKTSITLKQVMTNAQTAGVAVSQTSTRAESGRITAEGTVEKIGQLAATVIETVKVIQGLGEKSQQIGEIIETITSIADQTNLLALNAAIEAARAGEAGRGFAVVAEEVRKLAEGSAEAVRKIGSLIRSIQGETKRAVDSIETSSKDVQEGRAQVAKIVEILIEISKSAQESAKRTNEITAATAEQVKGVEHVVSAINEVAAIAKESVSTAEEVSSSTQEQTASMEEVSASAQELARLAVDLKDLVDRFKIKEENAYKRAEKQETVEA